MPDGCPLFSVQAMIVKSKLLRRGLWLLLLLLLLLAHALQLLVDLLRGLNSVRRFRLGSIRRGRSGGGRSSAGWRVDLIGRTRGLRSRLRNLDGWSLSWL